MGQKLAQRLRDAPIHEGQHSVGVWTLKNQVRVQEGYRKVKGSGRVQEECGRGPRRVRKGFRKGPEGFGKV